MKARARFGQAEALRRNGPFINVEVFRPASIGQPYLPPIHTTGLLDTGASITSVDQIHIDALHLHSTRISRVWTPHQGRPRQYLYAIGLRLILDDQIEDRIIGTVVYEELTVLGANPMPPHGVIIGRDILSDAVLLYDGPGRQFSLEFSTSAGEKQQANEDA